MKVQTQRESIMTNNHSIPRSIPADDDDFLVLPTVGPISPVAARMQKLSVRFSSPFDKEGSPIMMAGFKDTPDIGVVVTAQFSVEGEDRLYAINGKVSGSMTSIIRETDAVRVFEDGIAIVAAKEFETVWRGKRAKGRFWLTLIHLHMNAEFVIWLNNGQKMGDIEKRRYKVTPSGLVSTREQLR